jgi:hypothetical protein
MKWAIQLTGEEADFKLLEPCFQSNDLRIVKHDELWFLESERLNSFTDANGVWAVADKLLTELQTTFHLFAGASPRFALGFAQPYSDDGTPLLGGRAVRAALTINVVCPQGITKLTSSTPNGTFGSHVVSCAATDSTIHAALSLIPTSEISWYQIYDIIEFISPIAIAEKGWASSREVRQIKQTANHYRHLGRPDKNPLPPNPPTIHQARTRTLAFLRLWLLERVYSRCSN